MDKGPGLEEAIRAAGGIPALAHALDVALPSVSAWRHLPEKHVSDVEALTGVERRVLRPDLYPESGMTAAAGRDEIDLARSDEYEDRKSVVEGKSVSGSVDHGGGRK